MIYSLKRAISGLIFILLLVFYYSTKITLGVQLVLLYKRPDVALSVGHPRGTHSRYLIGCCLIPHGIYGLKNNSRRITYGIECVWGMPSLSPLSSLDGNYSTLVSHTNTVISHAFAYSSRWRRKP